MMELGELDRAFEQIMQQFPQERRNLVTQAGDKMYDKVIRNIDSGVNSKSGKLKSGVEKHVGSGGGYSAVRANFRKAPHTHLIENGHKIIRNGKVVGWVSGKHMYRNALNELANELEADAEQMINRLVGDTFG